MRTIDKLPDTPNLTEKSVRMISDLLFIPDKPFDYIAKDKKYDSNSVLQIMGNIAFLKDMFKDNLLHKACGKYGMIPRLVITGGINPEYRNDTEETRLVKHFYTESGKYDWKDVLNIPQSVIINTRLQNLLPGIWVQNRTPFLDVRSTNTKENFIMVKQNGWYQNVCQLRLFSTAESTLRVKATALKQIQNLKNIATVSYVATFPEFNISADKEKWAAHPLSRRYVYGELLRVIKYNETDDIKLTDIEQKKLYDIVTELKRCECR